MCNYVDRYMGKNLKRQSRWSWDMVVGEDDLEDVFIQGCQICQKQMCSAYKTFVIVASLTLYDNYII